MDSQDLIGFKVNKPIFCALCGVRRDSGGFALREPIAGVFCSAHHARIMVDQQTSEDVEG